MLILLLAACGKRAGMGHGNDAPKSGVRGYYGVGQDFRGGHGMDLVNIKSISADQKGKDTVVTFSFVQGSTKLGMEERALSGPPLYNVSLLKQPYRLAVRLEGVGFWDYADPQWGDLPLLGPKFMQKPGQTGAAVFYIHLDERAAYKVEESKSALSIHLQSDAMQEPASTWHVVMNSYQEYQQRAALRTLSFSPSLCDDGAHMLMLSPPFASEGEAQAFLDQNRAAMAQELPDKLPEVIELAAGTLPTYNHDADLSEAAQKKVIKTESGEISLPALVVGAQLLDWSDDGSRALYTKTAKEWSDDAETWVYRDEIWMWDAAGGFRQVPERRFLSVIEAQLSPDGRYIAILEGAELMRPLYVYDTEEAALYSAGEEGLGMTTWGFSWDDASSAIYAMSGETVPAAGAISYQLRKYDLQKPPGQRVSALEEMPGNDSPVGYASDYIYFMDTVGDSGDILRISESGGERERFGQGRYFQISPDRQVLFASLGYAEDIEGVGDIILYDLRNKDNRIIAKDVMMVDAAFTSDGRMVAYLVDTLEDSLYPLDLMVYDRTTGLTRRLGGVRAGCMLRPGPQAGQICLVDVHKSGDDYIPVTYVMQLP